MWQQDYRIYRLSCKEWLKYGTAGFFLGSAFLYFFYRTAYVLAAGIPCALFFCKWQMDRLCKARRQRLEIQFKDWIGTVVSGLQAGYSVENAFLKAGREMALLYGEETDIRKEIHNMEHLLANNITLEKILLDFGERSCSEDIRNFAEVFAAGKRSGGDLREMIENCCEIIVMKIDTEREIRTLLHGKAIEQKVMCFVPFGIIAYISVSSPGYFDPLYQNPIGIAVMTAGMIFYLFSVWLSVHIVRIEV